MFMVTLLSVYLGLSIIALLSHTVTGRYLRNFEENTEIEKKRWLRMWEMREKKVFHLKKKHLKRLKSPYKLIAFHQFLEHMDEAQFSEFASRNGDTFLAYVSGLRNKSIRAYVAYMFSRLPYADTVFGEKEAAVMLQFMQEDSVYLRENALKALYRFGTEQQIVDAFLMLSDRGIYHNEKLVADGMLVFSKDLEKLCGLLMESFDRLMECYRISFVQFMSYKNVHIYDEELQDYLEAKKGSQDLRCAMLRQIGRVCSEEICDFLTDYADWADWDKEWESMAVLVSLLGAYDGNEKAYKLLLRTISSPNWYVRMNTAKSLSKMTMKQEDLDAILHGTDRYAKNAMEYALANA